MRILFSISRAIDRVTAFFGGMASWLCLFLVLLTAEQVLSRYLFDSSSVGLQELEWHLFGLIFLLGGAHTLQTDGHVRVDILYAKASKKIQALIDVTGIILLLLPPSIVIIYFGIGFSLESFRFENPHPLTYYTRKAASEGSVLHSVLAPVEALLRNSVLRGEVSSDPGGLEARWLIKAAIPFGFLLLALQSVSVLIKKFGLLLGPPHEDDPGGN